MSDPLELYEPTVGDLRFRNADQKRDLNPFEEAVLLRGISDAYLSVLISDNAGERSAGYRAMLQAELVRRDSALAIRANRIAFASLVVAAAALVISLVR